MGARTLLPFSYIRSQQGKERTRAVMVEVSLQSIPGAGRHTCAMCWQVGALGSLLGWPSGAVVPCCVAFQPSPLALFYNATQGGVCLLQRKKLTDTDVNKVPSFFFSCLVLYIIISITLCTPER